MPLPHASGARFSYADYLTWPDNERWELIDGVPYNMTPAPKLKHQETVGRLFFLLTRALQDQPCTAYIALTDVVFSEHDVVQPDLLVVCDPEKRTEANIQGAPDLVVEIFSPATARKDRKEKKALYEKYGVREYLLVDPDARYAERFWLDENGTFSRGFVHGPEETLRLESLQGLRIKLAEVFEVEAKKPPEAPAPGGPPRD